MWLANRISRTLNAVVDIKNKDYAGSTLLIKTAVADANFLLEKGIIQDGSLPIENNRLVPSILNRERLSDVRNALVGTYYYLTASELPADRHSDRAWYFNKAARTCRAQKSIIPPVWINSRKAEAFYNGSHAFKLQYETTPQVEPCRRAYEMVLGARALIGMGFLNYSNIQKKQNEETRKSIESDMAAIFGIKDPPVSQKGSKGEEALMSMIEAHMCPSQTTNDPEWASALTEVDT